MTAKVLEGFSGKLAEQWVGTLLTPAFVFWAGGLAAYIHRFGWTALTQWFTQYKEPLQIAILVFGLCVVATSAFVAQQFDTEVLRGLEGYWYPGIRLLLKPLSAYQIKRRANLESTWITLNQKLKDGSADPVDRTKYIRIDRALRAYPREDYDILPTRMGNILRSAERRPLKDYGLDAIVFWPYLWLLLPESTRKDIQEARSELNNAVRLFLWSVLFLVWTIWTWWAIPIAIISASFAYCWSLDAAETYAALFEAAFAIHRKLLYQAFGWDQPKDPNEERRVGKQMRNHIWYGDIK